MANSKIEIKKRYDLQNCLNIANKSLKPQDRLKKF